MEMNEDKKISDSHQGIPPPPPPPPPEKEVRKKRG
jgi:hypothetical protein